jgi:hypothetical protein
MADICHVEDSSHFRGTFMADSQLGAPQKDKLTLANNTQTVRLVSFRTDFQLSPR